MVTKHSSRRLWALAVIVPVLAAAAAWPWDAIVTSAQVCETGSGGSALGGLGFPVLLLAAPATIAWQARRLRTTLARAACAAVASVMLALPLIFIATSWWWSSHDCMT
jgi:hypothetical protein